MGNSTSRGLSVRDGIRYVIKNNREAFDEVTKWDDKEYKQYETLLNHMKKVNSSNESTAVKGKALENIVNFIIDKSYLLSSYGNARTSTNEIDQVIVLNDNYYTLKEMYGISSDMLGLESNYFLGECKDYGGKVGVTWVGKFYSLMKVCGECKVGIIFSYKGLTGQENNWYASHGLTKVIYRIEPDNHKIYILDFNYKDFQRILNKRENFFDIIKSKKIALQIGAKSEKLCLCHENESNIKRIISSL